MSGAFDWGKDKGMTEGKEGKLPRHIERMNKGEAPAEMKKSSGNVSKEGLPWGGRPAEQKKAFMTGTPKNKSSVTSATGERKSPVGHISGSNVKPGVLPHESHPAHAGHKMKIQSVHHKMGKKGK